MGGRVMLHFIMSEIEDDKEMKAEKKAKSRTPKQYPWGPFILFLLMDHAGKVILTAAIIITYFLWHG